MKKHILLLSCFFVLGLTACHTSRKATASKSKDPKFIDDIYLDRHNRKCKTCDAVDKNGRIPGKKYAGSNKDPDYNQPGVPRGLREKYAEKMGVRNKDITNGPLYRFIDDWYGVSYHMGGQDKNGIGTFVWRSIQ